MASAVKLDSETILNRARQGERMTPEEALWLYEEGDLLQMITAARDVRNQKLPPGRATYTLFRIVNYSTECSIKCSFCSYYVTPGAPQGRTLDSDEVIARIESSQMSGLKQLFLQGGVNPNLKLDYYLNIISAVKSRYGDNIKIRALSPVEISNLSRLAGLEVRQLLRELKSVGVDSVPGAGAEILSDRIRQIISPNKLSSEEWLNIMRLCHEEGLPGSANIVFGTEERRDEVIEHLRLIRELQDSTGGLISFIPWTFQEQTKKFKVRKVGAPEFLKVLAICRLFLDNIKHIENSVMVLGPELGSLALHAGADDISSAVLEENVLSSRAPTTETAARDFIELSGFTPARRDFNYNIL